jgi:hypothetical protein
MSEQNVEAVRRLGEVFAAGDPAAAWAAAVGVLDPEIEMDMTRFAAPGLARVYTGLAEVAGFWMEWLDAWGSPGAVEDIEVRDAGDQVVWWARQTMRGRGSGVEIALPEYAWVASVRNGKIIRATIYMERSEALKAAGLPE